MVKRLHVVILGYDILGELITITLDFIYPQKREKNQEGKQLPYVHIPMKIVRKHPVFSVSQCAHNNSWHPGKYS